MSKSKIYVICRVIDDNQPEVFAKTTSKSIAKAFIAQRSRRKYFCRKIYPDDTDLFDDHDTIDTFTTINLYSINGKDHIQFFTTQHEINEIEHKLKNLLMEACSFENKGDDIIKLVAMYINLDSYFKDALEYLGFIPSQVDDVFNSAYEDRGSARDDEIDDGLNVSVDQYNHSVPSTYMATADINQIIYSIESVIKVWKEYL